MNLLLVGMVCLSISFSSEAISNPSNSSVYDCNPCDKLLNNQFFINSNAHSPNGYGLAKNGGYNRTLTREEKDEDLDILMTTLKTNHPGIYDYRTQKEIDSLFKVYREEAYLENDLLSFYEIVSKVVAAVGDAHTYPMNPIDLQILKEELLFPIKPKIDDNKIYINGKRLESINGHTEREILLNLQAVSNSDGNTLPYKNAFIEMEFPLRYFVSVDKSSVFRVKLKGEKLRTLKGKSYFEEGLKSPAEDPSLQIEKKSAILKIPSWEDDTAASFNNDLREMEQKSTLGRFIDQSMISIDSLAITSLTIDLRGNTGGKSGPAAVLLRHLIDFPFKYYREIRLSSATFPTKSYVTNDQLIAFYESEKAQDLIDVRNGAYYFKDILLPYIQPAESVYKGRLELLVDKYTLSVSTDVVAILSQHTEVNVKGSEIGGSLKHYSAGNYLNLRLPNSTIEVNVPLQRLQY